MPIDGVLIWKHAFRQCLADDGDGLLACNVELIEIAPGNDWDAEGRKKSGRDHSILRSRILLACTVIVTRGTELQSGTGADIAPGSDHPKSGFIDARKRIDATYDFLVKIDNLLLCLSVKDGGNIDGKDMARIHTGLCSLQREQRSHDYARAG